MQTVCTPTARHNLGNIKRLALPGNTRSLAHVVDDPDAPDPYARYFFKLFALNVELPDLHRPTKAALEAAMQGHILAQTEFVGL